MDYFSLSRRKDKPNSPLSPTWPRLPSSPPAPSLTPTLSSSSSSRGSWSSLFNTGSMRQFMSGVQDTLNVGLNTPAETNTGLNGASIPVPRGDRPQRGTGSPGPRRRGPWRDPTTPVPISKSWTDTPLSSGKPTISFSSTGNRRPTLSQTISSTRTISEKRVLVFDEPPPERFVSR